MDLDFGTDGLEDEGVDLLIELGTASGFSMDIKCLQAADGKDSSVESGPEAFGRATGPLREEVIVVF